MSNIISHKIDPEIKRLYIEENLSGEEIARKL